MGIMRTNGNGLDLNALLDVGRASIIGLLVREHRLSAERVDEGSTAWSKVNKSMPVTEGQSPLA